MKFIKNIKIKNFRSIVSLRYGVEPNDLNVLVGKNDAGKSNILRALNLFFNDETDIGKKLRFEEDFSYFSKSSRGHAKEIKVELVFSVPKGRFTKPDDVVWIKKWRIDSFQEEMRYVDKSPINPKNKVGNWLRKLKFRYVPATKGTRYFEQLMGELHDVLDAVHNKRFRKQGSDFVNNIQIITKDITDELEKNINIKNTLQVPSDFKLLFSKLDFGYTANDKTFMLQNRGDGIKTRHIPIILKYMAEQDKIRSAHGYVNPDTIWGFEEPENNLEMKSSFELASMFLSYSKDIQIFLTTHSPAFYSLCNSENPNVSRFIVESSLNSESTIKKANKVSDTDDLNERMGILPLISPYIEEINDRIKRHDVLLEKFEKLEDTCKCVVLTEDELTGSIESLLEINGFVMGQIETESYKGVGNVNKALAVAAYIKEKRQHIHIIIHRDKDYLEQVDVNRFEELVKKKGFIPLVTKGTDIESYYINSQHINHLYPEISLELAEELIDKATEKTEDKSLSRIIDNYLSSYKYAKDHTMSNKEIEKRKAMYHNDKNRFRYGKKVLSNLKGLIQKELKSNPDLIQASPYVKDEQILQIKELVWGITTSNIKS